jgi:5-formyltetrahydrofolate cyclo-ligase
MHPQAAKALLRVDLKKRRDSLSNAEKNWAAEKVFSRVTQMLAWQKAKTVCLYSSFQGELPTPVLIQEALRAGKKVALPRVAADNVSCTLHLIKDTGSLVVSNLGISEPSPQLPAIDPSAVDLFLVPGIGFDRAGHRLGHGAGFYDRLLAANHNKAFRLGYAYDFQILPAIPSELHDVPVDAIATPSEIITAGE